MNIFENAFKKVSDYLSNDIAIDLGTANTLVYSKGEGIILNEPSVVAIQKSDNREHRVLAVGKEAKEMLGRTPGSIVAVRPIKDGVIADFEVTSTMLKYFISKSRKEGRTSLVRPQIIICVPYGITPVEKRAVRESAHSVGAGKVHLMEEPMAAAIGAGLPIIEPTGNMVVDIGGGTTGVAVISLGGIVYCKSVKVGGDKLDEAITNYIRRKCNLSIGARTAEAIKIQIGSAQPPQKEKVMQIKGMDQPNNRPTTIEITSSDISEALRYPLGQIVETIRIALDQTPPELCSDIVDNGIVLTGGGALLGNMDTFLREQIGLSVTIAENPLSCVVLGSGKALDQMELLSKLTVT